MAYPRPVLAPPTRAVRPRSPSSTSSTIPTLKSSVVPRKRLLTVQLDVKPRSTESMDGRSRTSGTRRPGAGPVLEAARQERDDSAAMGDADVQRWTPLQRVAEDDRRHCERILVGIAEKHPPASVTEPAIIISIDPARRRRVDEKRHVRFDACCEEPAVGPIPEVPEVRSEEPAHEGDPRERHRRRRTVSRERNCRVGHTRPPYSCLVHRLPPRSRLGAVPVHCRRVEVASDVVLSGACRCGGRCRRGPWRARSPEARHRRPLCGGPGQARVSTGRATNSSGAENRSRT